MSAENLMELLLRWENEALWRFIEDHEQGIDYDRMMRQLPPIDISGAKRDIKKLKPEGSKP